ncbi:VWA domain-containing protein [Aquimonas voraii]|uniref:Ca-activated chloride channel family protein n=1 Tax=Aquimonas voraii TaxID=265719 RepID=A0A1G6ZIL7_9GAMM|nr:VWA domain-containing protein [Aquimonas voraii]SDE02448.1 Ca-activated chloride channel family protein [Aquimonas voraii]
MTALGLDDFHFLRPLWLLALFALPLLLWLRRRAQVGADPWRAVVDGPLLAAQSAAPARAPRLPEALLLLGVTLAVLALAGPAWRELPQPLLKLQAPLIVALDLSASVRAADLKPDRLSRARLKLAELIRRRSDGQTALVAFAGEAFTVAPLTDDATTLDGLLSALDPSILPVPGQRPERAIRMAQRLFAESGARRGDVLLLTDRVGSAAIEAAREAAVQGLRVSALGLGTPEGAPVAVGGGGFMRDEAGNIRLPRLDEASLRALAEAGQGGYARFAADGSDLRALGFEAAPAGTEVDQAETAARESRETLRYQDEGPLLALLLLPLAALAARRGWLLVLPLLVLPLAPLRPAQAQPAAASASAPADAEAGNQANAGQAAPGALVQFWNDLWARRDRQAWEALQGDAPERAAALAEDPALRGSAAYRAGDFDSALADFAAGDDASSHYNRGNALAKLQRYEEALAAYQAALERNPQHADAAANRQAVEDWLKQQQQSQSQSGEQGEQGQRSEDGQSGEAGEPPPEGEQKQDAGSESESAEGEAPPSSESPQNPAAEGDQGSESEAQQAEAKGEAADSEQTQQDFNEAMQQALEQVQAQPEDARQEAEPLSSEAMAEAEKRQALEQLMRRVPDDPGGLLRRKFLLEYQRRQREGEPR